MIVREPEGSWRAYCCTDVNATVAEILEAVADRSAIEQNFHDIKEVHGVGQQQLRNYWANIAAYHLTLWLHTLIEVWSWHKPEEGVGGPQPVARGMMRRAALRTPIVATPCARQCLQKEFQHEATILAV